MGDNFYEPADLRESNPIDDVNKVREMMLASWDDREARRIRARGYLSIRHGQVRIPTWEEIAEIEAREP